MKETKQSKEYNSPQFRLVRVDGSNSVFFAPSAGPSPSQSVNGSLTSMTSIGGSW